MQIEAKRGEAKAEAALGMAYCFGIDVEIDPSLSVFWFEKSANQGNVTAMSYLGIIYGGFFEGFRNAQKADYWTRKAAENGDTTSQVTLGDYYLRADNASQAEKWYKMASNNGDAIATTKLAKCYLASKDHKRWKSAIYLLRRAAIRDISAQSMLGYLYLDGRQVTKNAEEAYMWFYIVLENQQEQYRSQLDSARALLSEEQIVRATKAAEDFLKHSRNRMERAR